MEKSVSNRKGPDMEKCCECPLNGDPCCGCGEIECSTPSSEATRHTDEMAALLAVETPSEGDQS
jgi:hypothetical protein